VISEIRFWKNKQSQIRVKIALDQSGRILHRLTHSAFQGDANSSIAPSKEMVIGNNFIILNCKPIPKLNSLRLWSKNANLDLLAGLWRMSRNICLSKKTGK
jgi:hypothetical protein